MFVPEGNQSVNTPTLPEGDGAGVPSHPEKGRVVEKFLPPVEGQPLNPFPGWARPGDEFIPDL